MTALRGWFRLNSEFALNLNKVTFFILIVFWGFVVPCVGMCEQGTMTLNVKLHAQVGSLTSVAESFWIAVVVKAATAVTSNANEGIRHESE